MGDRQDIKASPRVSSLLLSALSQSPISSQPIPRGGPLDDSPLPNSPIRHIVITERDAYATAWPALNGHQSWAVLCPHRCRLLLASAELKQRPQPWEAGAIHDLHGRILGQHQSGPPSRRKKTGQSPTEEQRGKKACAFTARGSISKATKGLEGGAAEGSVECRKQRTTSPDFSELWPWFPRTWSKLKQHVQLGVKAGTSQLVVQLENKGVARQESRRSHTSN